MLRNQSRWRLGLNENTLKVLDDASGLLKWAWRIDRKWPKSFPVNTAHAFGEIKCRVIESSREESKTVKRKSTMPPAPPPPTSLSELIADRTVRIVYEHQNDGSYLDALKQAALGNGKGYAVWRKIWRALDIAFQVDYLGIGLAPMPRVHFLHREMLEIANVTELSDLTHEGIKEFLDDLCPCGKKHEAEAIGKLRKRWKVGRKSKRS